MRLPGPRTCNRIGRQDHDRTAVIGQMMPPGTTDTVAAGEMIKKPAAAGHPENPLVTAL
jgi:hypothetical protein